jgi:hypothetical protein
MEEATSPSKAQAWSGLGFGLLVLAPAAQAIGKWLTTGTLQFTIKHITATGPVAVFETALCTGLGALLVFHSIRGLRRFYVL